MPEPLNLDCLEALAAAARPGPWHYGTENDGPNCLLGSDYVLWCRVSDLPDSPALSTAEFIATANPQTVLALIAELREARRRCEGLAEKGKQSDLLTRRAESPQPEPS